MPQQLNHKKIYLIEKTKKLNQIFPGVCHSAPYRSPGAAIVSLPHWFFYSLRNLYCSGILSCTFCFYFYLRMREKCS